MKKVTKIYSKFKNKILLIVIFPMVRIITNQKYLHKKMKFLNEALFEFISTFFLLLNITIFSP